MRYLVTGAGGFLGSNVVKSLVATGQEVVAMDILAAESSTRLLPVLDKIEYRWQSVVDLTPQNLKAWAIDQILHFAALTDVPLANSSPRYTYQLNVDAAMALCLAARGADKVPVLAMSTENVYGSVPEERLPAVEDEPLRPKNSYAASKVAVEAYARSVAFQYKVPVRFIRSSTLFGPEMRMRQVVAIFCRQAVNDEDITIEGDGSQTRDFNYVSNMVDAIRLVVGKQSEGFDVFNIGSGVEWSLLELVNKIIELSGSKSKIVHRPWRPGEEGRLSISIEKAKRELGYVPQVSPEEGLKRLIDWMKTKA